jgi:hypothetical protein
MIAAAVLVLGAGVTEASGAPARSLNGRGAYVERYSGTPVSVPARLQPVVGSVKPGHTNLLTGKTKYSSAVYNPVLGSFGTYKFRR